MTTAFNMQPAGHMQLCSIRNVARLKMLKKSILYNSLLYKHREQIGSNHLSAAPARWRWLKDSITGKKYQIFRIGSRPYVISFNHKN